jgi:hypothetical protein
VPKILYFLVGPLTIAIMLIAAGRTDSQFSRDIAQPPAVVAAALESLDVVHQPHTQAKLPDADLGRTPEIVAQREADGISWFVMSGGKSVLRMKAVLTPASGGSATHVATSVEQGQIDGAPDVPKLFSSPSEMAPLFAVAVERALGDYIPSSERSLYSVQERPWGYREHPESHSSSGSSPGGAGPPVDPAVSFEPGKPMVRPTGH